MSCPSFQEMLSAYLDGELSPEEARSLEEHLAVCEDCRRELEELKSLVAALGSLPPPEMPLGLHAAIMGRVRSEASTGFGRFRRVLPRWTLRQWVPAAAALALIVLVSATFGVWYANRKQGLDLAGHPISGGVGTQVLKDQGSVASDIKAAPPQYSAVSPQVRSSGAGEPASVAPAGKGGESSSVSAGAGILATGTPQDVQRKLIERAQVSLEVGKGSVQRAAEEAMNLVKVNLGYVESSSLSQSGQPGKESVTFYMVARVPQENLDKTIQAITALGKTLRHDTSVQDITDQYVDLDARLRNKQEEERRLLQIMGEAKTVGELLQVEGELSRVRGEIESIKAQLMLYDKSVAMSSLSLTVVEEGTVKPPVPSPWRDVWNAFVNAWRSLLMFVAKILPAIITLGVLGGAALFALLRRKTA